ncbi:MULTISPECIES: mechanosensitive ion channel family protein [Sporosarcina]|uniref:mechanosensitive ion channel family protein n=1 Tax=Sporosarcina TaxID=1569 RepID=UPI00129A3857|nr:MULTISPECIES: mechanosensitive ion channel domain-containing protein [Sporosarcina]GKV64992.1 hypothetical protein NCCP2331_11450 [Sporosarcina sp. NCCP-2331]GLB56627.1 hypothetical protein NCCP2378_24140 [Sporosarcina sp. NCCP-2378]
MIYEFALLTIPVDLTIMKELTSKEIYLFFLYLLLIFIGKSLLFFLLDKLSASSRARQHVVPFIKSLANWVALYGSIFLFLLTFSKKKWLFTPFYQSKGVGISLFLIIMIILVITFANRLAKAVTVHVMPYFYERMEVEKGMQYTVNRLLYYLIMVIGIVVGFRIVGLSLTTFALLFSALGVGIGFGIRNVAANFVSGIIMLFERPIEVGEYIEIEGRVGKVERIKLRSTDVTVEREGTLIVPNQYFIEQIIKSRSSKLVIADVKLNVKYTSNTEKVSSLLKELLHEYILPLDEVLEQPEPAVRYTNLGSDSVEMVIEVPVRSLRAKQVVEDKIRQVIAKMIFEHEAQLEEAADEKPAGPAEWRPDN